MNLDELNEVMAAVTYKPGWSFDAMQGLVIRMRVPDSATTDHDLIEVFGRVPFDLQWLRRMSREEFLRWMFEQIMRMERHEAQEWFRFRGDLVDDPHAGEKIDATER